jgi:hypothetical protein
MSDWRSSGSAVRRRAGAPSNHFDSVGSRNRVSLPTPEEALAGMAQVGSPRVPMGTSMVHDFTAITATPVKGTLVPKGNTVSGTPYENQSVPPANQGLPANRVPIQAERLGAAYRIGVNVPAPMLIEATSTQANGRVVTSAVQRDDNFGDSARNSYA